MGGSIDVALGDDKSAVHKDHVVESNHLHFCHPVDLAVLFTIRLRHEVGLSEITWERSLNLPRYVYNFPTLCAASLRMPQTLSTQIFHEAKLGERPACNIWIYYSAVYRVQKIHVLVERRYAQDRCHSLPLEFESGCICQTFAEEHVEFGQITFAM